MMRKLFSLPSARLGLLLMAIGAPVCICFSRVTLPNEALDQWIPVAGCALCLLGASMLSKCIAALRSEK